MISGNNPLRQGVGFGGWQACAQTSQARDYALRLSVEPLPLIYAPRPYFWLGAEAETVRGG